MKLLKDIPCQGKILAVEYISNKNSIAVSLSDRTIIFLDTQNLMRVDNRPNKNSEVSTNVKVDRKLGVPSTQKCLTYVKRIDTLFSAGVDGAIFGWNMTKLFSNEFAEQQLAKQQKE